MSNTISKERLELLRRCYPSGTRVALVKMDDVQAPPIGSQGSVIVVDDMETVHIHWDCGSSLGAVYGEDIIRKLEGDGSE